MDKDPSMEDILASIRRIINEEEAPPPPAREADEVLELVEPIAAQPQAGSVDLSQVDGALDGVVRDMLKPMLRDWLDANLPDLVRAEVAREIVRITRRD